MAQQLPTKNGKRRRNFFISDSVMERVKQYADVKGTSMAQVLEVAATKFLDAVARARASEQSADERAQAAQK